MPHSNRRRSAKGPIPQALLLSIAGDLQAVTQRIAEIKELCEWQLSDLTDAGAAAAAVHELLAGDVASATEIEPGFLALVDELSKLHARLDAHVITGRALAHEFLGIARAVERELGIVHSQAADHARLAAEAKAGDGAAGLATVISLQAQRAARSGADALQKRAGELSRSLRDLQEAVAVLFQAQAQSGPDVAALRLRLLAYQRQLGPARD